MSLGLRRKALVGTLEVIVYAGVLFLLYRIIVRALGIEAMGIWSLVMAAASFLRFADAGVGSGVGASSPSPAPRGTTEGRFRSSIPRWSSTRCYWRL